MKLQYELFPDFIVIDKPNGFSTHSPDIGKLGICEIFQDELSQKLFIAQRLDKTTTGLLLFAKSSATAAKISELLSDKEILKTYKFVTDRVSAESSYTCSSDIDGKKASTEFTRIKRSPFFELWEARPKTGRQHQIRIHAAEIGLPILGDPTYAGTDFPHLCLHAWQLKIPAGKLLEKEFAALSPPPVFIDRLGLLKDQELVALLSEIDRRQRLYNFLAHPKQCLRIVHSEDIRIDMYGSQLWIYWYKQQKPTSKDLERFEFIAGLLKKEYFLKYMQDRGKDPNQKLDWQSEAWQSLWQACENSIAVNLNSELGQSPGLFLDQRKNRAHVYQLAEGKSVLNLFAYTCGFSLAAVSAKATSVTSVDLSAKFLEWGKKSIGQNQHKNTKADFFAIDVLKFLKGAEKHQRSFDIIICDPPSFGRSKDGVFQIEKQFDEIVTRCWNLLAPGGFLMFSTNFEKWSSEVVKNRLKKLTTAKKIESLMPFWDYELPNQDRLMKSFWLSK